MKDAFQVRQDKISGDRRADKRYGLALDLRYRGKKGQQEKSGTTRDISAGGVLFISDEVLPRGQRVELSIDWPVLLHGVKRLRLKIYGRVVRSDEQGTAVSTIRHEFFTAGLAPERIEATFAMAAGQKFDWSHATLQ